MLLYFNGVPADDDDDVDAGQFDAHIRGILLRIIERILHAGRGFVVVSPRTRQQAAVSPLSCRRRCGGSGGHPQRKRSPQTSSRRCVRACVRMRVHSTHNRERFARPRRNALKPNDFI